MNFPGKQILPDAQRLLASLPQAIVLLEPGLRIVTANQAAEQFLGQGLRRLAGRQLTDAVSFGDPRFVERFSDSETPISARDVIVTVKGRGARKIDMTMSPVADSPGWQLLTIHDSSTTELLGELPGAGDSALLRGPEIIAHEIKNPLAGIRGAAQLLARDVGTRQKALTDLITSEVDRIASLIERMQRLSRKTVEPVAACNLHEAVRRAIAVLDAAEGSAGPRIPILEEFDPSLPPVLGNSAALVQVLINLLSNAREACREVADASVTVRTRFASGLQLHHPESGTAVRLPIELRVSDNGPGVDPAMRDHIFEPFVTSNPSGQGLGLALVHKLVRDMKGRIGHERDEERGLTHFRIHLPMTEEAREPRRGRAGRK
jgi:two-component system, NtrC family, nitrogen regulation sensor histidine kinase GlnL